MAALLGIDVDRTVSMTFVIGAALAAVAGIMYLIYYGVVSFSDGFVPGVKAFTAAVLGGIGSLPGAVLGGLLIGLIETLWSAYFSIDYKDVAAFSILAITLIFMPSGHPGPARSREGLTAMAPAGKAHRGARSLPPPVSVRRCGRKTAARWAIVASFSASPIVALDAPSEPVATSSCSTRWPWLTLGLVTGGFGRRSCDVAHRPTCNVRNLAPSPPLLATRMAPAGSHGWGSPGLFPLSVPSHRVLPVRPAQSNGSTISAYRSSST